MPNVWQFTTGFRSGDMHFIVCFEESKHPKHKINIFFLKLFLLSNVLDALLSLHYKNAILT